MNEKEKKALVALANWDNSTTDPIRRLHAERLAQESSKSLERSAENVKAMFDSFRSAEVTPLTSARIEYDLQNYTTGLVSKYDIAATVAHLMDTDPERWGRIETTRMTEDQVPTVQKSWWKDLLVWFERLTGPGTSTLRPASAHFGTPTASDLKDEFPMPDTVQRHFDGPVMVRIKTVRDRQIAQVRLPALSDNESVAFALEIERTLPDGATLGTVRVPELVPRKWTDIPLVEWRDDERWRFRLESL